MLIWATSVGNVQPLIIASLVHGIDRRSGPLWIGIAASLKAVPIVYVLLYLGRREWSRVFATLVVAALLTAPLLVTPLRYYPAGPGDSIGPLWALHPVLVGAGLALLAALTIRLASRRSSYARLLAAGTLLAALPRITLIDLSGYSTQPGPGNMSLISVGSLPFLAVAVTMVVLAFVGARSRYPWLLGALAMIAALPRMLTYEISFLLVGLAGVSASKAAARESPPPAATGRSG
jgi:hypothetical protein